MEDTVTARDRLDIANKELGKVIVERERMTHQLEVLLGTTDEGICARTLKGASPSSTARERKCLVGMWMRSSGGTCMKRCITTSATALHIRKKMPTPTQHQFGRGCSQRHGGFLAKRQFVLLGRIFFTRHSRRPGVMAGVVVTFSDITKRRSDEEKLLASEVRYRRLFESAKDGILILDADSGNIVDVNPFLMELLDFPRDHFMGKQLWEIGYFRDIAANQAAFRTLKKEKYIRYDDLPLETKSGRFIRVEFVSNLYDVSGKQIIQCNIRDITERKVSETSFRQLAAIVGVFRTTPSSARISKAWSPVGTRVLKSFSAIRPVKMVGTSILRIIPVDRGEEERQLLAKINRGEIVDHLETLRQTKDGRLIEVSITASPIRDAAGRIIGASKMAHDISERIRAGKKIQDQTLGIDALAGRDDQP